MEQVILPAYRVGSGILEQSGDVIARYGKRVFVIHGQKAWAAAGERLLAAMRESGLEIAALAWYGGECTKPHIDQLAAMARESGAEVILGVGGGKALDTAKGCADQLHLPIVTVPTIASTCAAVTAISVLYDDQHAHAGSLFFDQPPAFTLIDLEIIAQAPIQYLRAGVGDAMAKHVECTFSSRGRQLSHSCATAVTLSRVIYTQLMQHTGEAFRSAAEHTPSEALRQVVLVNIVTTGMVSLLIDEPYNGALAHAICYGLTRIPGFEKRCLHGDAVGYGVLVQLLLDHKQDEYALIHPLFKAIGIPTTLRDIGYTADEALLGTVIPHALRVLYLERALPYRVDEDMLKTAMLMEEG